MQYRGLMDGWHGDEPEIEASSRPWDWSDEPEDEWDDRRQRELEPMPEQIGVQRDPMLAEQINILKNMWSKV